MNTAVRMKTRFQASDERACRSCNRRRCSTPRSHFAAEPWSPRSHAARLDSRRRSLGHGVVHPTENEDHPPECSWHRGCSLFNISAFLDLMCSWFIYANTAEPLSQMSGLLTAGFRCVRPRLHWKRKLPRLFTPVPPPPKKKKNSARLKTEILRAYPVTFFTAFLLHRQPYGLPAWSSDYLVGLSFDTSLSLPVSAPAASLIRPFTTSVLPPMMVTPFPRGFYRNSRFREGSKAANQEHNHQNDDHKRYQPTTDVHNKSPFL